MSPKNKGDIRVSSETQKQKGFTFLKYSYFYVFSANFIPFFNISNWVISSTLMVVILIFMLMTPFIGEYELILKFKALCLVP